MAAEWLGLEETFIAPPPNVHEMMLLIIFYLIGVMDLNWNIFTFSSDAMWLMLIYAVQLS